jgi:hypothetical protein
MEKIDSHFSTKKRHSIMMRLDTELYQALKQEARRMHIPVTTMIKLWIVEKLQEKHAIEGTKNA